MQGDDIQPWHVPFPIWNQSVVSCPVTVLTIASWPAYKFLKRQIRWSGIPISFRIFHSLLWSTQSKAFNYRWFFFYVFIFGCAGSLMLHKSSLVGGYSVHCSVWASHWGGFSWCRAPALGAQASEAVALKLSCPVACGIFPDQGSNPCPLHCKVDS